MIVRLRGSIHKPTKPIVDPIQLIVDPTKLIVELPRIIVELAGLIVVRFFDIKADALLIVRVIRLNNALTKLIVKGEMFIEF